MATVSSGSWHGHWQVRTKLLVPGGTDGAARVFHRVCRRTSIQPPNTTFAPNTLSTGEKTAPEPLPFAIMTRLPS
jgi:hypothetical protein